jgi:MFS family permease
MMDDPRPGPETSRWLLRREPRFARLWAAKAVSHLGDGAALVALVVYVQQIQGRGVAVSALLLAGTLPTLLGPLAGALVDRVEQRRLMLGALAGQAVLYGAMAAVLPSFPVLLVLVAAASLLATVFAPAGRSVVPSLVPPTDLVRANSWMGMALTFQGTIGPAVGGVLFAAVDDVALVFLAREDLHAGAVGFGVLVSLYGIGFALAQAVAGSGNGLEVVATDTLVQRSVPRSHRGRVFGVVSAATLLGGAIARGLGGVLVDLTSARATFVIGGSGVLLVTLGAGCSWADRSTPDALRR